MFLRRSISVDAQLFIRWACVTSAFAVTGLMNYIFIMLASQKLESEQFNDLVFLFSISTALTMIVSPVGATILGSKSSQSKKTEETSVIYFLKFASLLIVIPTIALLSACVIKEKIGLTTFLISIIWIPILFLMSFGTALIQIQKRFLYFGLFPILAAGSKLVVLRASFSFNLNAVKIVFCIQVFVALLALIQFKISGGLGERYLDYRKYHFMSAIFFFLVISLLLSGEVFLSRLMLPKNDIYIVALGIVLGKLSYLFSVPLVDLVLADLYSEPDIAVKKEIVKMTVKRIILVSSVTSFAAFVIREPFFQFIKGDRDFVSNSVLMLLLLNGFLGTILQLLVHFSISTKQNKLIPKVFLLLVVMVIGSIFFGSDVLGVLSRVTFALAGSITLLTFPNLFNTCLFCKRKEGVIQ